MPTHYKGSPSEIATLDAFIKLTRASNTLHHQLSRSLAEYNLTESQFGVLEALYYLGPLNQRSLGEKILTFARFLKGPGVPSGVLCATWAKKY